MEKVLVTGGAGYIGSVLVHLLIEEGYSVRVLDNLSFGGESLLDLLNHRNFEFMKGDVRDETDVAKALDGVDYVAHLAAIVGDPACAKQPEKTKEINLEAPKKLYQAANKAGVKRFIFASTCSNYGKMDNPDLLVDENSKLAPVSLYAETKVATEHYLFDQPHSNICKPVVLRFSTVYGSSPRPRFDLTVNEFTKELALGRELVIFGEQFWRPYCHVVDLSRSVITAINASGQDADFQVFNVGDTSENYQKQMIVDEIKKVLPEASVKYIEKDEDPRDYRVSFKKIQSKLGFKITQTVPDGIKEIKQLIVDGFIKNPDDARYRNV